MRTASEPILERRLGPFDAAAIIVSNVIGGGILFTPPQVAASIPNAWLFLAAWAAGGFLAFAGAMAYAELAALRPRAGGEYVYLRHAYGSPAAFLSGWTSFVAGFSGAIATSAVVLTFYLARFIPAAGNSTPFLTIPILPGLVALSFSPQTVVAVAAVAALAWIHRRGVGPGRLVGNALAAFKTLALVIFVALGFSVGAGHLAHLGQAAAPVLPTSWLFALIPVMFTYSGWNAASYVAEEIREPGRNVPRALALGTGAVIAIYLALNVLYLFVFPINELAQVKGNVLEIVGDRLLGGSAGSIMGVVGVVSLLASISAMTFAGPRVYYAMARDGVFFKAAANIHPSYKTPAVAIVAQSIWSTVLVLTGSANTLTTYTGFAVVLFSGLAVTALFVLRVREPNAERPFKALGYPVAPGIFAVASLLILLNALWTDLVKPFNAGTAVGPSAWGFLVIGLGLPLYWWFSRSRSA